jgi:hypothetical protein
MKHAHKLFSPLRRPEVIMSEFKAKLERSDVDVMREAERAPDVLGYLNHHVSDEHIKMFEVLWLYDGVTGHNILA